MKPKKKKEKRKRGLIFETSFCPGTVANPDEVAERNRHLSECGVPEKRGRAQKHQGYGSWKTLRAPGVGSKGRCLRSGGEFGSKLVLIPTESQLTIT